MIIIATTKNTRNIINVNQEEKRRKDLLTISASSSLMYPPKLTTPWPKPAEDRQKKSKNDLKVLLKSLLRIDLKDVITHPIDPKQLISFIFTSYHMAPLWESQRAIGYTGKVNLMLFYIA